jgi:hypothetical protein
MNEQLLDIARREVAQCREKGLSDEDTLHMALDACVRYGHEQGTVGEELSQEMRAAFEYVVHEAMNPEPILHDCPYCPGKHAAVDHCPLKPRVGSRDDC